MSDRMDKIRAREKAATEGPWFQGREWRGHESERDVYSKREPDEPDSHDIATHIWSAEDATFIAHAREDIPWLLARLDAVRGLLDGAPMVPQAMVRKALDGDA